MSIATDVDQDTLGRITLLRAVEPAEVDDATSGGGKSGPPPDEPNPRPLRRPRKPGPDWRLLIVGAATAVLALELAAALERARGAEQ